MSLFIQVDSTDFIVAHKVAWNIEANEILQEMSQNITWMNTKSVVGHSLVQVRSVKRDKQKEMVLLIIEVTEFKISEFSVLFFEMFEGMTIVVVTL